MNKTAGKRIPLAGFRVNLPLRIFFLPQQIIIHICIKGVMAVQDIKTRRFGFGAAICLVFLAAVIFVAATGCKEQDGGHSSAATFTTTSAATDPATTATAPTTTASSTTPAPATPDKLPAYGWCVASSLHVRKTPNTYYEAIGGLQYGERVTITGIEGDWYKIKFKDGAAFVKAEYISLTEVFPTEPADTGTTAGPDA